MPSAPTVPTPRKGIRGTDETEPASVAKAGVRLGGCLESSLRKADEVGGQVGAQVVDDGALGCRAGEDRLPGDQVLGPVEVSGGDTAQAGSGDPREEVLPVDELVPVDEAGERVSGG